MQMGPGVSLYRVLRSAVFLMIASFFSGYDGNPQKPTQSNRSLCVSGNHGEASGSASELLLPYSMSFRRSLRS